MRRRADRGAGDERAAGDRLHGARNSHIYSHRCRPRLLRSVLEATARRGPSALKFHNARLFVAGQGLSNIGTFSQLVALSLLVLQLTDSGLALGAVMAAQALPFMLLGPWAGSVLDRLPLRRVLLVTALLGATQAACLAAL